MQGLPQNWVRWLLCLVCALAARGANAQAPGDKSPPAPAYPSQPITAIVPFPAGGPTDVILRLLAEPMSKALGQRIVIENVAGAGGTLGSRRAARSKPDGYTILVGNMGTHGAAPALYPRLEYDPVKDFEPIGMAAGTAIVIEARKGFPASNLKEFVAHLKAHASEVNEAHAGVGSISYVACLMLHSQLGIQPARVAYRGTAAALNDLVGGQVDYMCDQILNGISQVKAGTIQAFAIASAQRSSALPNVPTTREAGLPQYQVSAWNALFAPQGTPQDVIAKLNFALSRALEDPAAHQRLLDLGCNIPDAAGRSPEALRRFVSEEVQRWTPLLKADGAVGH
ncbi:MAG TPA: tripartite tricarboxylate transporter substrate-binding protein [Polyangiaceae bacterium]|jgi:tripartite-type tricarboxylate transporter receptor subunit TctC|nr:tripartite tricarboxylate transporter substrate-binding protein [Polyangiaceae bacterium]